MKVGCKNAMVSIVVPAYNVDKYIKECLKSLCAQTYCNIEILVISDGSTDSTVKECQCLAEEDKRIKIIEKENGGVSSARNVGIKEATGDYIMFVDGDDWLEPTAVKTMLEEIIKTHVDVCFCNCYYRNKSVIKIATQCTGNCINAQELIRQHLRYKFIASPCLSLSNLSKIRQCLFNEEIHTLEDWEYNFRVLTCIEKATVISTPFYHYREVSGSASKSKLNEKKLSCFLIPKVIKEYIHEHELPYDDFIEYIWIFLLNHMLVLLANSEYTPKEATVLKVIARDKMIYAFTSKQVPFKQRIYILMCSISPKVFCFFYRLKHLN